MATIKDLVNEFSERIATRTGGVEHDGMRLEIEDLGFYTAGHGHRPVWVCEDGLILRREDDRILRYYGGFDQVSPSHRIESLNFIIYLAGDDSVDEVLKHVRALVLENTCQE